jgi:hypothetical protein
MNRAVGIGTYKELLPQPNCPPKDANQTSELLAYRLIPHFTAQENDFMSHAALGKPCPPHEDTCRWASCSFFINIDKCKAMNKLPSLKRKYKHIAHVKLGPLSGMTKLDHQSSHLDVWMFAAFDPLTSVIHTEPV